jgi:hypothetical protein
MQYSERLREVFNFREQKSKELKRLISYSEALALWLTQPVQSVQSSSTQFSIKRIYKGVG